MVQPATSPYAGQAAGLDPQSLPYARQHFGLRVGQFVVTLVIFGLFGAARGLSGANIFAGVWTFLITIYHLASHYNPKFGNMLVALILDVIGMLIWFGGFISAALFIGAAGRVLAVSGALGATFALAIVGTVCGALLWLSYVAAVALDVIRLRYVKATAATAAAQAKMQEHDPATEAYKNNVV